MGSQNASGLDPDPPYVLFPGTTAQELNLAAEPYHLGDVTFYVLNDGNVMTADPFTGAVETTYGAIVGTAGDTYGDLVMQSNGQLYTISRGVATTSATDQNAAAGQLCQVRHGQRRHARFHRERRTGHVPLLDDQPRSRPGSRRR